MSQFDYALRSAATAEAGAFHYYSLRALEENGLTRLDRLPYSIRVLLESVLRLQAHPAFSAEHVQSLAAWAPGQEAQAEFPFMPARVLLQDFTGVPCVVDLAALRDAVVKAGRPAQLVEPLIPVDLVIDHSVQIDLAGTPNALQENMRLEFARNQERYQFLRWGQQTFKKLRIVPPGTGICHQANLEYLAQCVRQEKDAQGRLIAFPDTLIGTDSHTTMINGLGVLGWGVGGIEAEAAMLGQPIPMLTPVVVGVRLVGELAPGATATDLALAMTQILRAQNVVGQFVEYFGPGLDHLALADRATVANMAPEYGATMGFFPIDEEALAYLQQTGRSAEQIALVRQYCELQGLWRSAQAPDPQYSKVLEVDLAKLEPCVSGPKRPHDRLKLGDMKTAFQKTLQAPVKDKGFGMAPEKAGAMVPVEKAGTLRHGAVVIASITSCTNTSNPAVMLAAGLVARKAVERGLQVPGTVKPTLAPGSRVVEAYLAKAGVLGDLEKLGFNIAAYGCATCIGNSGPLPPALEKAVRENELVVAAVLSGNRNFEGRIHPAVKANYLCSPPLVIMYALAGRMDIDLAQEPLQMDGQGRPVFMKDLWPDAQEIRALLGSAADPALYRAIYEHLDTINPDWNRIQVSDAPVYAWAENSTYIRNPQFIAEMPVAAPAVAQISGARALAVFGDFITTDHISPAGSIAKDSPAGKYLMAHGVTPAEFNSYGARRGNHEVMVRGTFGNVRLRNKLADREGGWTLHLPGKELLPIYEAAMRYQAEGIPCVVLAGKMYGAGSSRDWAAKGTAMLGVRAVIAESFERIHRSNLVEMGVLPLEFVEGQTVESLGLTGREIFHVQVSAAEIRPGMRLTVTAEDGQAPKTFPARCRIDSAIEVEYYRHGGIVPYVFRQLIARSQPE